MDTNAQEMSFEESLKRLEEVVGQLERGEAPLEKGLELFEEGVALSRRCHDLLSSAEKRISRLTLDEDGRLELFPREEEGE